MKERDTGKSGSLKTVMGFGGDFRAGKRTDGNAKRDKS